MKKILLLLLLVFGSVMLVSCNNKTTTIDSEKVTTTSDNQKEPIKDTEYGFIDNGTTEYVIVIPNYPTENEEYAAKELNMFLAKATGIDFVIAKESGVSNNKILSVGFTNALKNAGINPKKEELGSSGYIVKTINDNVYMSGAEDLGTIYSVYKFLEEQVGYKYYSYDCIKCDTVVNANLKDFNIVDAPDFEHRYVSTRNIWDHKERLIRLKFQSPYIDWQSELGHNAQYIINYDAYGSTHPEWFVSPTALCYSAGESLENEVAKHFEEVLASTPVESGKMMFFFGQSDSNEYCTCDKCSAAVSKYGSITATMIIFMNHVGDKLQAWIDENQPGRDVEISFYAYLWSQQPPVQYDKATDAYSYSEDVIMHDNVGVIYTPIRMNYYLPIEEQESEKNCVDRWSKITKNLYYYGYYQNYSYAMYLFNNFDKQIADYKYFKDLGVTYIFEQDFTWVDGWQTFSAYKSYLTSNRMWDVNCNSREITVDFFNNYYGAGAPYVLKYFDEWKSQYTAIYDKYGLNGTVFEKQNDPRYWPMSLIEKWIGYMDDALDAIERYKYLSTDLYKSLYRHIMIEKTTLQYQMIDMYGVGYYKSEELVTIKREVLKNMEQFSMIYYESSSSYANLLQLADKWGVSLE